MATLATDFRKLEAYGASAPAPRNQKAEVDPYALRPLPNEDVFFYCKRIENRVVRQADPRSRGACWSAIGAAFVLAALLTSALAPSVANTFAGYKIQALKQERQRLLDERAVLAVEEARLLSPARMQDLAERQRLAKPASGQVIHLDGKPDASLASLDPSKDDKVR